MKKVLLSLMVLATLTACNKKTNQENKEVTDAVVTDSLSTQTKDETPTKSYAVGTTDEAISEKIRHVLRDNSLASEIFKIDLKGIKKEERRFQFQTVDLNNDGRQEVFINFITPSFCGTGGCTLLLLDSNWQLITKFTVTNPPIMIESHEGREWALMMVKDAGAWKELKYENGKYPSNPSLLPKSSFAGPSSHAQVLFSDEFAPAKTFEF